MFFIVNKVDGAGLFEYHYSLILATLKSSVVLTLVLFIWFLYVRKFFVYVSVQINRPESSYLYLLNSVSKSKRLRLFFILEVWLLLPILLYVIAIVVIGIRLGYFLPICIILVFLILVIVIAAVLHVQKLSNIGQSRSFLLIRIITAKFIRYYPAIIISFIVNRQKFLWLGLKTFSCGILYLIARNNTQQDYEIKTVYLFYSFGILGQAILIRRIREFEEDHLQFFRGLPLTKGKRLLYYAILHGFLLLPEFITITCLAPIHLHYADAFSFLLGSYSLYMLISSISFAFHFTMKDFLKLMLLLFFIQYFFMMAFTLFSLSILFFILSVVLFYKTYYSFERVY
jgi:hypothetical protein